MHRIAVFISLAAVAILGCERNGTEHAGAIAVPEPIASDPTAQEIASIWADGQHQTVLIADRKDWTNAHWGLMAADFMRHAAKARAGLTGQKEEEALAEIKQAFDAEWENPTDTVEGGVR